MNQNTCADFKNFPSGKRQIRLGKNSFANLSPTLYHISLLPTIPTAHITYGNYY